MNSTLRTARWLLIGSLLAACAFVPRFALAQTPAQMEYERQQREYWRQQEQQRQDQQRQQQLMNENARRQQEESQRWNQPQNQGGMGQQPQGNYGSGAQPRSSSPQGAGQDWEEARRTWEKRPPLPADRNPLLGRWTRPASSRGNSSDPFAALGALVKGGLCELLFGDGVFEFRRNTLVGIDGRMNEQELDQVEYRGDARRVAVVPKSTLKLMVFDFDGPNRISWAGQNCMLVRVGAAPVSLAAATPATAAVSSAVAAGAVLHLAAGYSDPAGGFRPLAGSRFVVLKESIEKALSRGGFQPAPGVSVLKGWTVACQIKAVACAQGLNGINADSVGSIRTDVEGRAQVSALAAGTYYVFGTAQRGAQAVIWNVRVELRPGTNSVVLDQRNATLVN